MPIQRFRTKPFIIQAIQLTANNRGEVAQWIGEADVLNKSWDTKNLYIRNPHGELIVEVGHWVIKGTQGEFYPCDDHHFQLKYERDLPPQPIHTAEGTEAGDLSRHTAESRGEVPPPDPTKQPPNFQPAKKPRSV